MMNTVLRTWRVVFLAVGIAFIWLTTVAVSQGPPDLEGRSPVLERKVEVRRAPTPQPVRSNLIHKLADPQNGLLSNVTWDLLSDLAMKFLSGNKTDLLSGNKAAFLSGNRISLFSNINIKIEISDSGNHNGNHGVPAAMAARFQALDQNQDGQVSIDEYSASKAQRKMQQVKKRFRRLDRDKNQKLTIQEFGQPDR